MHITRLLINFARLLACHLHTSDGNVFARTYTILVEDTGDLKYTEKRYGYCQNCLIRNVEAIGLSVYDFNATSAVFSIITTRVGHRRVRLYCDYENICPALQRLSENSKGIPREGYEIKQQGMLPLAGQPAKKPVCLVQSLDVASMDCRMCLREKSEATAIGDFLIVKDEIKYIVYVMGTSHPPAKIEQACYETGVCAAFTDVYTADQCEMVHVHGVSRHYQLQIAYYNHAIMSGLLGSTLLRCIKVWPKEKQTGKSDHELTLECIGCLGKEVGAIMHWMNVDAVPMNHALVLFMSEKEIPEDNSCEKECPAVIKLHSRHCFKYYRAQFSESAPRDQVFTNLRAQRMSPDLYDPTECVLAHIPPWKNECLTCLRSHQNGKKPVSLSDTTSLLGIEPIETMELASCIGSKGCVKLVFVHNDICEYEYSSVADTDSKPAAWSTADSTSGRYSGSADHTISDVIDSARVVTAVVVRYKDIMCLICLAREYEVLVVSYKKKYVWTVQPTKDGFKCPGLSRPGTQIENFRIRSPLLVSGEDALDHALDTLWF